MPIPEYAKAYIADQFRNAISQLEVICGRPFDWKKFKEVKDQTQRSVYHWNRIADMAQYKPSPLNGFDLFNYMALIVACRSLDYAEITFKAFADELEKNLKAWRLCVQGRRKNTFPVGRYRSMASPGSHIQDNEEPGLHHDRYSLPRTVGSAL